MLVTKNTSNKKMHRFDSNVNQKFRSKLTKGDFGLKSLSCSRITFEQLDSVQKTLHKKISRFGKVLIRVFPNLSITKKPSETRMGKGKGNVDFWCFPIKIGQILVEFQPVFA
jgi:large subunit ribosomal protein L16